MVDSIKSISPLTPATLADPSKMSLPELQSTMQEVKPPLVRPELILIKHNIELDKIKNVVLKHEEANLIRANEATKKAQLESLEAAKNQGYGSYVLEMMTSLVTSFFFLYNGYSTVAANPVAGGLQMAGGTLGFINTLLSKHYGWNWMSDMLTAQNETWRERVRLALPFLGTCLTYGLAAYGISKTNPSQQGIENLVKQAFKYFNNAQAVGKIYTTYQSGKAELRSLNAQADFSKHLKSVESVYRVINVLMEDFRKLSAIIKKSFKATIHQTNALTSN